MVVCWILPGGKRTADRIVKSNMRINVAVCGKFHYHNYIRYLDQAGFLGRFFYSHRLGTNAGSLGIGRKRAKNLWLKEYLLGLHNRLTSGRFAFELMPLYADAWQAGVLRNWNRCDILHLMLHGTSLSIIERAKQQGSCIVVEPVNQHPTDYNAITNEEHERLGLKPIKRLFKIQERQLEEESSSDFLLAPSVVVRDSYVKRGYDPRRTAVLSYGVDLFRFRPPNPATADCARDKTFRVICVAHISPRKGHLYLLEAWKQLRLPQAELLLIGAVPHEMRPLVQRYNGIFRHIPVVPNSELKRYYASASVFVLPSVEDGFGVVCGEAMACGLPVIVTSNTGAADIVSHGKDGFVVPIRSPEAIASSLELLYRDRQLRTEMSQAAAAKAIGALDWRRYAMSLIELYIHCFDKQRLIESIACSGHSIGTVVPGEG
jgi:glycosyltransferase involved in cell wall biosynthesis